MQRVVNRNGMKITQEHFCSLIHTSLKYLKINFYNIYANPEYTAVVRINECVRKFFVVM